MFLGQIEICIRKNLLDTSNEYLLFQLLYRVVAVLRPLHHPDPELADPNGVRGRDEHRGRREAEGVHRPPEGGRVVH